MRSNGNTTTNYEHYLIEYQLRLDGKAVGDPMTFALRGDPKEWRKKQVGGAVLLSATPITPEEYLMKTMGAEHRMVSYYGE